MDNELVSNSGSSATASQVLSAAPMDDEAAEVASIEADFVQFDEDFGTTFMAPEAETAQTSLLDQAAEGTPFAAPAAETGGTLSLLEMADGNYGDNGEEGLGSWVRDRVKPIVNAIKNRAKKIIKKMVELARRLGKYAKCVGKIVAAITAFKAKKYGTAIKAAYEAFKCIRAQRA
ncbi:hypothetical protein [Pseudooctadecabacter jejudonensis]|uniref:Uncharacterized protein n=1 Tax=Pseudooctadecabacter jejudonensis TaxID=1391910 RepID=A0A1Y5TE80_9RHOB|nr:hypothetical protein [Pseudooctadecabacter jejudonensis]SLN61701.1 hypothetical protein PSJ8397_03264 [Pseudooctadecabacter jejudonensis]